MKKYRLLKDTPDHKKGFIFSNIGVEESYWSQSDGLGRGYPKKTVENNPEWFELLPDTKVLGKIEYTFTMYGFDFEKGVVIINGERLFTLADMEKCWDDAKAELFVQFNSYKIHRLDKKITE